MNTRERSARTAWGLIAEPGDSRVWRWLDHDGPVEALAQLRSSATPTRLASRLAAILDPDDELVDVLATWRGRDIPARTQAALALAERRGVGVVASGASGWPVGFDDLGEYAPHTLWVMGDVGSVTSVAPWVAIVGSRRASGVGIDAVRGLIAAQWATTAGLVSGGALGIDAAAHAAALARGMPTIAVLAGGLDSLYPSANTTLFGRIVEHGALISESPCTERALPHRFLGRNRLIAALADAVIVVEAAARSGALNTAGHAAALGRPTGVVPGRWGDPLSAGCWRIVRERHAVVLTEPDDAFLLLATTRRDRA